MRSKRKTTKKIYWDLKEMSFPGSYRALCYFIANWREGKDIVVEEKDKNFERLDHPPADTQVNFGITEAVKDGKYMYVHCLVMSLPYSNAAYESLVLVLFRLSLVLHYLNSLLLLVKRLRIRPPLMLLVYNLTLIMNKKEK